MLVQWPVMKALNSTSKNGILMLECTWFDYENGIDVDVKIEKVCVFLAICQTLFGFVWHIRSI